MTGSFVLSLAAVDILWERFDLGLAPFPFEIPHNGRTAQERASITKAVLADLGRRSMARGDQVHPGVEEALRALANPEVALTAYGMLDDDKLLLARTVRAGKLAVRAVRDGQNLRFEPVRPTAIVAAMIDLIPEERPAVGQSVTLSLTEPDQPSGGGALAGGRAARSDHAARLAAEAIFRQPRKRIGQFGVMVRGRHGRERRAPELGWFDTASGRFLSQTRTGKDGQSWVTYSPADRARLGHLLGEQLAALQADPQ